MSVVLRSGKPGHGMNRILTADVILTLTAVEARGVCESVEVAIRRKGEVGVLDPNDPLVALYRVLHEQCAKQGV